MMAMLTGAVTTPFESELLLLPLQRPRIFEHSVALQGVESSCGGKNGGRRIELGIGSSDTLGSDNSR